MSWDSNLLPDQRAAVSDVSCHICVLAGPGTGKTLTLTRRILYLIQENIATPGEILALTFTRAAAHELRQRVANELSQGSTVLPRISTLHSFALSQLLRNAPVVMVVPRPLRIADDWEERNVIEEDIKRMLGTDVKIVRHRFNQLSSDWQTLQAEGKEGDSRYADPQFLGAWQKHRETYGYMLRSELVYQLKKSLEQNPDFTLEQSYKQILVDEYQDLNRCDLAVVKALTRAGGKVFVTGDDDQSIYGFRFAHPQGIRMFDEDYNPHKVIGLERCLRCDRKILELGLFVANLDPKRIPKPLRPREDASYGEVHVLWFDDQDDEAKGVAKICKYLTESLGFEYRNILILLRTDRHGVFSSVVEEALNKLDIPVASRLDVMNPLDERDGREFLSVLRLCVNPWDHLAWRTLLQIRQNGIGEDTIQGAYDLAVNKGFTFAEALRAIQQSPELLPRRRNRISQELESITNLVSQFNANEVESLPVFLSNVAEKTIVDGERRKAILAHLEGIVETSEARTPDELLSSISTSLGDKEQEIDPNSINILTMHKAKGLTADVVFIVGAEDEYLPGSQLGEEREGDERRLLYVSLTRARHALFMTYCRRRTGQQRWTGRNSGQLKRSLSRFLIGAPIKPESGRTYCQSLPQSRVLSVQ